MPTATQPAPKIPRPTPRVPTVVPVLEKPSFWSKVFDHLLEGAMVGTGFYFAMRIIRHYDRSAPSDSNAINP